MNETALDLLCEFLEKVEGVRLKSYDDGGGVWTIGAGLTGKDITRGLVWTREYADERLKQRAQQSINEVTHISTSVANASARRVCALASFAYNLGIENYQSSTLRKNVDAGDWESAQKSILKWNKRRINGELTVSPGLTKRRRLEAAMLA